MLLVSDGVTEWQNESGEQFGERLLIRWFHAARGGAQELVEHLLKAVSQFAGRQPPKDDFTAVALCRKPVTSCA